MEDKSTVQPKATVTSKTTPTAKTKPTPITKAAKKPPVVNPYITGPVYCKLSAQSISNIPRVHVISIDSYPNTKLKFFNYIDYDIYVPDGSNVEKKFCNPHVNYAMSSLLGVNTKGVPVYKGMKVSFLPTISCIGTAQEVDLTNALTTAGVIAKENSDRGINTVISYPINGSYNTKAKIAAMKTLANTPRTYFMISSGNNNQADWCSSPMENDPAEFVIGASVQGNKLSTFGNIGDCVKFYTPGRYKSTVNNKVIWGTSFSMPVAANILINSLLAHPDFSREQTYAFMKSNSVVAKGTTWDGSSVNMNIFPNKTVCNTTIKPAMLASFNAAKISAAQEADNTAEECAPCNAMRA